MEKDILKNEVQNFIDAADALEEFLKNFSENENKEEIFISALKLISNHKNELFKDLE